MADLFPIFVLICAPFAVIVVILFYGMYRSAKATKSEFDKPVPASAKVIKVGESYNSRNYGEVIVDLTFEVTPPSGSPYQLTKT